MFDTKIVSNCIKGYVLQFYYLIGSFSFMTTIKLAGTHKTHSEQTDYSDKFVLAVGPSLYLLLFRCLRHKGGHWSWYNFRVSCFQRTFRYWRVWYWRRHGKHPHLRN